MPVMIKVANRRIALILSSAITAAMLLPQSFAFAASPQSPLQPNPNSAAAIQYEQLHHASHSAKVQALINDGLSPTDAEYYATLDDEVAQLEANHTRINLGKEVPMTAQQIAANPDELRKRVLSLDPAAIKATLLSPIYSRGNADINSLIKQHPNQNKYVVQYPDGSSISATIDPGTLVSGQSSSSVTPQGYQEQIMSQQYTNQDGNWQNGGYTWKYQDGSSYSSVGVFGVDYSVHKDYSSITGFQTGQSSFGIVEIANASGQINYPSGYSNQTYAQVENQVVFDVTGSVGFSASLGWFSMGVSVNAGAYWTQYAIFRVYGNGLMQQVAAQYT